MELSILIPTYNYDCQLLVDELTRQAESIADLQYEIIVLNDKSTVPIHCTGCRQIDMDNNVGRAKGRNILANESRYRYLLFIDSDSMPASGNYLSIYADMACEGCVLMGGRVYDECSDRSHSLLPKYGQRERNHGTHVSKAPFVSPNFLIDREVFCGFNESLTGYGHEDTLFGIELHRQGTEYKCIDNPVIHKHIESNSEFLAKTKAAVKCMAMLTDDYPELGEVSTLLKWRRKINLKAFRWMLPLLEIIIVRCGSVKAMQVWKLIYISGL